MEIGLTSNLIVLLKFNVGATNEEFYMSNFKTVTTFSVVSMVTIVDFLKF